MKALTVILLVVLGIVAGFLMGIKRQSFNNTDKCLDMGGGVNPGNSDVCVVEK